MSTTTKSHPTWHDLCAIEPTLKEIDRMLDFWKTRIRSSNQWEVYERMKSQVWRRVGYYAKHAPAELQTTEAYVTAIEHVCEVLGI